MKFKSVEEKKSQQAKQKDFEFIDRNQSSCYIQMANLTSGNLNGVSLTGSISHNSSTNSSTSSSSSSCGGGVNANCETKNSFRSFNKTASKQNGSNPLTDDGIGFIDDVQPSSNMNDSSSQSDTVYNFPWDFKLKSNPLLLQVQTPQSLLTSSSSSTSSSASFSQPSTSQSKQNNQKNHQDTSNGSPSNVTISDELEDESQYCAPWDLKLQEEMLKLMAQKQQTQSMKSTNVQSNHNQTTNEAVSKQSSAKSSKNSSPQSQMPKTNKSSNDLNAISNLSNISINSDANNRLEINEDEYSPPWEHKQSILLQNLANSTQCSMKQSLSNTTITNSSTTTPTNATANGNQIGQNSAISLIINQFNKTSNSNSNTRSNRQTTNNTTSSSSSPHSSTSSLSPTNSPPSVPPPLPPSMPPPPPPITSTSSLKQQNFTLSNISGSCQHTNQLFQQSPRLSSRNHHHLIQQQGNNQLCCSRNINGFAIVPSNMNLSNNGNTVIISNGAVQNFANNQIQLNEMNKFCSWGSNCSSSGHTVDTLGNGNRINTFEDQTNKQQLIRQQSTRSTTHQFGSFPHQQQHQQQIHFQTVPSTANLTTTSGNQQTKLVASDICQVAVPVTALVFSSQNGTLATNILPINVQQQAVPPMSSPTNVSSLERQIWYHGRITRKQAENFLNNKPVGSFLVRQSESGNSNDYSLSLVGSGCVHMRICLKNGEFILGQCSQPFPTIVKMIEHYGKVEVPIKGAQHVKLHMPISTMG